MKKITIYLLALAGCFPLCAQPYVTLENEHILVQFDTKNGALVRLTDKHTGWNAVERKELGQSFQMLVPIEGKEVPFEKEMRFNNVDGVRQQAPQVIRKDNSVSFRWNTLVCDWAGKLDIGFTATAMLTDDGLIFSGDVENSSPYVVEYVAWPYFGEIAVPGKPDSFYLETRNFTKNIYPGFPSESGYWGVDYPTTLAVLPSDGFVLLRNGKQGLYLAAESIDIREQLIASFELIPGYELASTWPSTDEMDGEKVRIEGKANHVAYAKPGELYTLNPTRIAFYEGGWHKGADIYRAMIRKPHKAAEWVTEPEMWRRVTVSDASQIVDYAKQCVACGVTTLVVGRWTRSVPYTLLEPIPRLASAIAEARRIGCRVLLDGEFFRVDPQGAKYDGELRNYLLTDPYRQAYDPALMCPMSSQLNTFIRNDYAVAYKGLGADGFVCNDPQSRWRTSFCFRRDHGHRVPQYIGVGIDAVDRGFAERARKADPDYMVGGSYQLDAQSDCFDFMLLPQAPRTAIMRYLNPDAAIVATVNSRYAREDINACVLNRYTVCFGELFGSDDLTAFPGITAYAGQVKALRERYRDFIWEADMLSPEGVRVDGNNVSYTLYKNRKNGRRAVVVVNNSEQRDCQAKFAFDDGAQFTAVSPEQPQPVAANGEVSIPALSLVVILEK